MYLTQFDIQTAFLNGLIDTMLYMMHSTRLEVPGPDNTVLVCLVLYSLYDFKQSGRICNQTFNFFVLEFDPMPTTADPCVYISRQKPVLIVYLFVDDDLAGCTN